MGGHTARVGSLSWNEHVLSRYSCFIGHKDTLQLCICLAQRGISLPSGSRSGQIHHHDVRVANHHISTLTGHSQEVCGLQWSPDGRYLASGGNDNLVHVWPRVQEGGARSQFVHRWNEHEGAVKVNILLRILITAFLPLAGMF